MKNFQRPHLNQDRLIMEKMELLGTEQRQQPQQSKSEAFDFMRALTIKLRLPPRCLAAGCFYFHTVIKSQVIGGAPSLIDGLLFASACIFLAAKAQEHPRHVREVVSRFYDLQTDQKKRINPRLEAPPLSDGMIEHLGQRLLAFEFQILGSIGFDCMVDQPYDYIEQFQCLELGEKSLSMLKQCAKCFANDSLRADVGLHKSGEQIARVCLLLAAQHLKLPLIMMVDEESFKCIKDLYARQTDKLIHKQL